MPAAAAVPTSTGTTAAGSVRGRAPAIQAFMAGQLARSRRSRPNPRTPAPRSSLDRRCRELVRGRPPRPGLRRHPAAGLGARRRRAPDRPAPPRPRGGEPARGPRPRPRHRRRRPRAAPFPAVDPSTAAMRSSCRPAAARARPRGSCTPTSRCGPRPWPPSTGLGVDPADRRLAVLPPALPHRRARRRRAGPAPSTCPSRSTTTSTPTRSMDAARRGRHAHQPRAHGAGPHRPDGLPAHRRRRLGPARPHAAELPTPATA